MAHSTNTNAIFADPARLKKIIFLTGSIDSALSMLGCDPFSAAALEYVLALSDEGWQIAARQAGVLMPSATTIAAIEDLYRKRIEIRVALSRIA